MSAAALEAARRSAEAPAFAQCFSEPLAAVELLSRRLQRSKLFRRSSLAYCRTRRPKPAPGALHPAFLRVSIAAAPHAAASSLLAVLFQRSSEHSFRLIECCVCVVPGSTSPQNVNVGFQHGMGELAEAPERFRSKALCYARVWAPQEDWSALEPDNRRPWSRQDLEKLHERLLCRGEPVELPGSTTVLDLAAWTEPQGEATLSLALRPPRPRTGAALARREGAQAPMVHYHFAFPMPVGTEVKPEAEDAADGPPEAAEEWRTWMEVRGDLSCAFCASFVAPTPPALLAHLRCCHPQLDYEAFLDEGHRMHCIIRSLRLRPGAGRRKRGAPRSPDASPPRRKAKASQQPFLFHKRQRRDAPATLPRVPLRDADEALAASLAPGGASAKRAAPMKVSKAGFGTAAVAMKGLGFGQREAFVPVRQYYHSRTYMPLLPGELDIDSDEDLDDSWMHEESERLLDEFEDVSAEEKVFMKLWNRHARGHVVHADQKVPQMLRLFVQRFAPTIVREHLWEPFLFHAFNLWDNGLVSREHLLECAAIVSEHRRNYPEDAPESPRGGFGTSTPRRSPEDPKRASSGRKAAKGSAQA